jgi:hypothetical protein
MQTTRIGSDLDHIRQSQYRCSGGLSSDITAPMIESSVNGPGSSAIGQSPLLELRDLLIGPSLARLGHDECAAWAAFD